MSDDKLFDIPAMSQAVDPAIRNPYTRLREAVQTLMGLIGDGQGAAYTDRRAAAGLINVPPGSVGLGGAPADESDLTPAPRVVGLRAAAGFASVIVQWDAAVYTQGHGHGQTNLYGVKKDRADAALPTFGDAQLLAAAPGALTILSLDSDLGIRWHLWAKWQTVDGIESLEPAGGVNGVVAQTGFVGGADLAPLAVAAGNLADGAVDLLSGKVKSFDQFGALAVGYTVTQYLLAKSGVMQNLVVDDAQIGRLSAAKLNVGDGTVGGNLKSANYAGGSAGWLLRPDGYFEVTNAVVRGTIVAAAGTIGGITIGLADVRSPGYVPGTSGHRINADGSAEFYNLTARGNITANSLNAATGTFSGALAAATGTFAGTLSAATGSFSGSLAAATGTFSGMLTAQAVSAVDTINLAGNAVTVPIAGNVSGTGRGATVTSQRTTTVTIGSISTSPFGAGRVTLLLSPQGISSNPIWWIYSYILAEASMTNTGGPLTFTFNVLRVTVGGATVVWTLSTGNTPTDNGTSTRFLNSPLVLDVPGPGVLATYQLQIVTTSTADTNHGHEILPFTYVITESKR